MKLREIRLQRKMTLEELSELSGVNRVTINRYELGQRTPSVDMALKLASALGCTVEELFADTEQSA